MLDAYFFIKEEKPELIFNDYVITYRIFIVKPSPTQKRKTEAQTGSVVQS